MYSPTTSVFDHSSFQKEENVDTTDFFNLPLSFYCFKSKFILE